MSTRLTIAAMAALLSGPAHAANCTEVAKQANRDGAHMIPRAAGVVVGAGRVSFHSAPLGGCGTRSFLVPNDRFVAYQQYRGWTYVMYVHPVSGADTSGWLPSTRLLLTGTIGGEK
jgi:hypothetical protein